MSFQEPRLVPITPVFEVRSKTGQTHVSVVLFPNCPLIISQPLGSNRLLCLVLYWFVHRLLLSLCYSRRGVFTLFITTKVLLVLLEGRDDKTHMA